MSEERALYEVIAIRNEVFNLADEWVVPTPEEIKELMRQAGLSGSQFAKLIGIQYQSKSGGRTVRRWTSGDIPIPYAAWALLAYEAGYGIIWKK